MRSKFVILTLLGLTLSAVAVQEGFQRYQIIIDKRPFGEEPPEAPGPTQIPLNQSFAKDLRLTMLFEGPGGDIRAGIVNNALNKNYILKVGQGEDNIELVEADIEKSEAMLKKGNEVALFKLEEGKPEPLTRQQQTSRTSSYAKRRQALLEKVAQQKKAEQPETPPLTGEALRKHLEDVQMNAIREGLPPLPLPLTPEMDAQLVNEGILPPQ
jgi:hypothetical protein